MLLQKEFQIDRVMSQPQHQDTDYPRNIIDPAEMDGVVFGVDVHGHLLMIGPDRAKQAWLPVVQVIAADILDYIEGYRDCMGQASTLERCADSRASSSRSPALIG